MFNFSCACLTLPSSAFPYAEFCEKSMQALCPEWMVCVIYLKQWVKYAMHSCLLAAGILMQYLQQCGIACMATFPRESEQ